VLGFGVPQGRSTGERVVLVLALLVAVYGVTLAFVGDEMYPQILAESFRMRPLAIFVHALGAALALGIGPFQLDRRPLAMGRRQLHRNLGKVYVVAALIGNVSGLYMSVYSHGGLVTHVSFGLLALLTFSTTLMAYVEIRRRRVIAHREWMIRSYALLFAAVTLRFELPFLVVLYPGAFTPAYQIVSWLCWVPNLAWAEWYVRRTHGRNVPAFIGATH
jgi:uncharacterized membrane protein